MKNILLLISIILIFSISNIAFSQCNSELYVNKSMRTLNSGYQFTKSYRIDGRNGVAKRIKYTCVFSKDTNYQMQVSGKDGLAHGIIGTLYDSRKNKLVSSYYNNKFLNGWVYKCKATGIYQLEFSFKDSKSYCGAAVLGFKR